MTERESIYKKQMVSEINLVSERITECLGAYSFIVLPAVSMGTVRAELRGGIASKNKQCDSLLRGHSGALHVSWRK